MLCYASLALFLYNISKLLIHHMPFYKQVSSKAINAQIGPFFDHFVL